MFIKSSDYANIQTNHNFIYIVYCCFNHFFNGLGRERFCP